VDERGVTELRKISKERETKIQKKSAMRKKNLQGNLAKWKILILMKLCTHVEQIHRIN